DVEKDAAEMASGASLVPNEARPRANPAPQARSIGKSKGDVEAAAALSDVVDRALHPLAVSGLEPREQELIACRLIRLDPEQDSGGLRPLQLARAEVEVPGADPKAFDPDAEMLAATVGWRMRHAGRRQAIAPILPR